MKLAQRKSSRRHTAVVCSAIVATSFLCLHDPSSAAEEKDTGSWSLVKGITGTDSSKAASIVYSKDEDTSSTSTSAALLWRYSPIPSSANFANAFGASLGYSKNTLNKKRSEFASVGGNARSIIAIDSEKTSSLVANLDLLYEDDIEKRARGNAAVFDVTLISAALSIDPGLERGKKETGVQAWLYPSAGVYRRQVSSTDSPADTPRGIHGGTYATLRLTSGLLTLGGDDGLLDRLSADISGTWIRESAVSGGYSKDNFRFAEASISYLLYGSAGSKGWKPSISITRSKGTNRVANEPYVDKTEIGLKVSFGI